MTLLPDRGAADGVEVPIQVRLVQAPSRTLRYGVGYGTDTGARSISAIGTSTS